MPEGVTFHEFMTVVPPLGILAVLWSQAVATGDLIDTKAINKEIRNCQREAVHAK
jgi:hypothetical protein